MKKNLHTLKNLGISTEGAYSKLLLLIFEKTQGGIMYVRLKENIIIERMPQQDSFNLSICGSIASQLAICNGCKDEKDF